MSDVPRAFDEVVAGERRCVHQIAARHLQHSGRLTCGNRRQEDGEWRHDSQQPAEIEPRQPHESVAREPAHQDGRNQESREDEEHSNA